MSIRKVAINTGGGDAPGLNAVIRAIVLSSIRQGWEVVGIRRGYHGLTEPDGVVPLDREAVRGITHRGGTILGAVNKGHPFAHPVKQPDGSIELVDNSDKVLERFEELGIDVLFAIGGDGSLSIANKLSVRGLRVIGVPKTIDNDVLGTVVTFGFDTAVSIATEALERLHTTAEAHERVMVCEVMGRNCGWIALNSGVAATADVILMPEIPFDFDVVCEKVRQRDEMGRGFTIIVVSEGAYEKGGQPFFKRRSDGATRLGGIGEYVADEIGKRTGKDTRSVCLGHLLRGGGPSTFDRLLSLRFGAAAVRMAARGQFGAMVGLVPPGMEAVPLDVVVAGTRNVPLDCDTIRTARILDICLGDQITRTGARS